MRNSPFSYEIAQVSEPPTSTKEWKHHEINRFLNFLEKVVSRCNHFCETSCVGGAMSESFLSVGQVQQNKCCKVKGRLFVGFLYVQIQLNLQRLLLAQVVNYQCVCAMCIKTEACLM